MRHLDDDVLTELHYGDAEPTVAAEGRAHLSACADCRARRDVLAQVLASASAWEGPSRGEEYAQQLWARVAPQLALAPRAPRSASRWRRHAPFVGLAAALLLAFVLGRHSVPTPSAPTPVAGEVRERVLLVAVGDHLDRSQMLLVELVNAEAGPGGADLTAEREAAGELVGDGRLFRQAAARSGGEPAMVDVLDDLERLLVEVARGPEHLDAAELARLQQRIEAQGLLFKVRVVGARVREREQDAVRAQSDVRS
jgi:hypothetical protein